MLFQVPEGRVRFFISERRRLAIKAYVVSKVIVWMEVDLALINQMMKESLNVGHGCDVGFLVHYHLLLFDKHPTIRNVRNLVVARFYSSFFTRYKNSKDS